MSRHTNAYMDQAIKDGPIRVLDHGFVEVMDYMGDDRRVLETARTSTAGASAGLKGDEKDRALLRFLLRKHHTTPFESSVLTVRMRLPLFVARQLVRYRMATLNEESARYAELAGDFYVPDQEAIGARPAKGRNRQGRGEAVDAARATEAQGMLRLHNERSEALYRYLMTDDESAPGIALELARLALPVSVYTTWVWTINLHSLMHVLRQRLAPDAQHETRAYAKVLAEIVRGWCPWAWEAFEDYQLGAVTSSRVVAECVVMAMRTGGGLSELRRRLNDNAAAGRITTSEVDDAFTAWSSVAPLLVPGSDPISPLCKLSESSGDAGDFVTAVGGPAPAGFTVPLVDPSTVDWSGMTVAPAGPSIMLLLDGDETTEQVDKAIRAFRDALAPAPAAPPSEFAPFLVARAEQPQPVEGRGDMWEELIEQERDRADSFSLRTREMYIAHMSERRHLGIERYGRPLQIGNGRDVVVDLFQEILDATVYMQQLRRAAAETPGLLALPNEATAREVDRVVLEPMAAELRRQGLILTAMLADENRRPGVTS